MIIITDIHGCFKTFLALLAKLPATERICVAGDLVDRGPMSSQLIQYLIDNKERFDVVTGNHEKMMIDGIESEIGESFWRNNGGTETLKSYEIEPSALTRHIEWMKSLPYYIEYKDVQKDGRYLIVSHASIQNEDLEKACKNENIIWNREIHSVDVPKWFNVFGHSPLPKAEITSFCANIDTGCVYPKDPTTGGKLTALQFPEMIVYEQDFID
jgi:serine/threonine protein phosphatase 1